MSKVKVASKRKTSRKVKEMKTSRVAEAIKVLDSSIEDSIVVETVSTKKRARTKKVSSVKKTRRS